MSADTRLSINVLQTTCNTWFRRMEAFIRSEFHGMRCDVHCIKNNVDEGNTYLEKHQRML
jgi:hypothetical protein